jgi:hypothetical protein
MRPARRAVVAAGQGVAPGTGRGGDPDRVGRRTVSCPTPSSISRRWKTRFPACELPNALGDSRPREHRYRHPIAPVSSDRGGVQGEVEADPPVLGDAGRSRGPVSSTGTRRMPRRP